MLLPIGNNLSPAYDLLSTRLVIPDDQIALSVQGKKDNLDRATWLRFAEHSRLGKKVAARVLDEIVTALDPALALVERSPLPAEMKASYARILRERANALVPRGDPG